MSASTKLSNSVKALCFLAKQKSLPQSSATLSASTGVNASKLRRLLADLAKVGIVTPAKGASGGYVLARSPSEINLQEIYCAIEDRKAFHLNVASLKHEELLEAAAVNSYFLELFSDIQIEIEKKMEKISLENIIEQVS